MARLAFIVKTATLSDSEDAFPVNQIGLSASPAAWRQVMRCAVEPVRPDDLPRLLEHLRELSLQDNHVAATGEQHMNNSLRLLRYDLASDLAMSVSEPVVCYRETVTRATAQDCTSRSPDELSWLSMRAEPLGRDVTHAIDQRVITPQDDVFARAEALSLALGWPVATARKVWAFGPDAVGSNLIVDASTSSRLQLVKDEIVAGFEWVTKEGVLCEEPMRGVAFSVLDSSLDGNAVQRAGGQIIPTARRVMYSAQYLSGPRLMEPDLTTSSRECVLLVELRGAEHACPAAVLVVEVVEPYAR
ncbi:ribosomal protein S5 domain 2-type protein [Baffinella frigidus]|nr:ribosomal protein S5 domain 2-type protein [Cryptophyta sp. CCMP2293]